jgi:hypothetical protein
MSAIIPKGRMKGDINKVGHYGNTSVLNNILKGKIPVPSDPIDFWTVDINNDSMLTQEDYTLIKSFVDEELAPSYYTDYYNNWHVIPNPNNPAVPSLYWETYIDYPGLQENDTIYIVVQGEHDYSFFRYYDIINDFENARIIIKVYKELPLIDLPCFIFCDSTTRGENLIIPQKIKYMDVVVD